MFTDIADPELTLLRGNHGGGFDVTGQANHALKTAPIITGDAFNVMGSTVFPQRALYGSILETSNGARVKSPKLYINTNAPFSGIICGVQVSFHFQNSMLLEWNVDPHLTRLRRALERAIPPLCFWKVASLVTSAWVHFQNHWARYCKQLRAPFDLIYSLLVILFSTRFHFDTAAGVGELPPCEAACIGSLEATRQGDATPPTVVVLVL